jgi:hypothetical protein
MGQPDQRIHICHRRKAKLRAGAATQRADRKSRIDFEQSPAGTLSLTLTGHSRCQNLGNPGELH